MAGGKESKLSRIGIEEVRQRMGEVVFVDARSATSIGRNPIQVPGAIHLPLKDLERRVRSLPKKGRTLVTYCS